MSRLSEARDLLDYISYIRPYVSTYPGILQAVDKWLAVDDGAESVRANLGVATTGELLDEIRARLSTQAGSCKHSASPITGRCIHCGVMTEVIRDEGPEPGYQGHSASYSYTTQAIGDHDYKPHKPAERFRPERRVAELERSMSKKTHVDGDSLSLLAIYTSTTKLEGRIEALEKELAEARELLGI